MSNAALDFRTLRAGKPVQVVMVHGLFSNGAFWIPHLGKFADFQVTLITVDYGAVLRAGGSLDDIARRIDELIGDKPAHFIGHSFGSWLGMRLKSGFLSRSFICPTFAAQKFSAGSFCEEIARRTGVECGEIEPLVGFAVDYKARHVDDLMFRDDDNFYLAEDDPYFRYVDSLPAGITHRYRGGHFDVTGATGPIALCLAPQALR